MKRVFGPFAAIIAAWAVSGCPVYSDDEGCFRDSECAPGFVCERNTGACIDPNQTGGDCSRPSDCSVNETCGEEGRCELGDCTFSGCVSGYRCAVDDGEWQCVESSQGGAGGEGTGGEGGEGQGGAAGSASPGGAGAGGDGAGGDGSGGA